MKLSRRLLLLPLLLLVPLGVLKWRFDWVAEHPPLSKSDKWLRNTLNKASVIKIRGDGTLWESLAEQSYEIQLVITDKKAIEEVCDTLRLEDVDSCDTSQPSRRRSKGLGEISILSPNFRLPAKGRTVFAYAPCGEGGRLFFNDHFVAVRSRFAPRFEALITRLVKQAKADGHHPEIRREIIPP